MSDPRNNGTFVVGVVTDPEVKELKNGSKLVELRVALDRALKDADDPENTTLFLNAVVWDNGDRDSKFIFDQVAAGNLKKGSQVILNAALKGVSYTNKEGTKIGPMPALEVAGLSYQRSSERKDSAASSSEGTVADDSSNNEVLRNF